MEKEKFAFVKPALERLVRDPATHEKLSDTGKRVRLNTYWRRRIADGDVILVSNDEKGE